MKIEPRRYDVIALRDTDRLCCAPPQFEELRGASLEFNQALLLT